MLPALVILSIISNGWCSRSSETHFVIFTPIFDELVKTPKNQPKAPCVWKDPPDYAENFRVCGKEECEVEQGTYEKHGTVRITHCDPGYELQGQVRDVCHNGEWSSSGHLCKPIQVTSSTPSASTYCTSDEQCPDNRRCLGHTCLDMCPRSCGNNSYCKMVKHFPVCTCPPGFKGNPYVSCTQDAKMNHGTPVSECRWFTDPMYLEVSSSSKDRREPKNTCLTTDDQNPGGFTTLRRGEFPYLGIIGDEEFSRSCYGVLISERWFLSSADCCETCNKKVKLGIFNENVGRGRKRPEFDVIERYIHPEYAPTRQDLNNIGLYKLKTSVKFSQDIRPACLVREHQLPGTEGVFIGKHNGALKKTTTEIWSERQCDETSSSYKDESMFCIDEFSSESNLQVYTGLPLVGPMGKPYCMHGILGLATFGGNTKSKGYTRLSHFVPWIEGIVSP